jgi:hypothetical protein
MNDVDHIDYFLKTIMVDNYIIHDDFSVSVYQNLNISNMKLKEIPIKFRYVLGDFNCSFNFLTTLKGCPKKIDGNFNCTRNELTSIDYPPKVIEKDAYFLINNINSFDFPFNNVGGLIYMDGDIFINKNHDGLKQVEYNNGDYYNVLYNYNKNFRDFKRKKILTKILKNN